MIIINVIELDGGRIEKIKSFVIPKKASLTDADTISDIATDYFIKKCKKIGWGKNGEELVDLESDCYYWDGGSKEVEMIASDKIKTI